MEGSQVVAFAKEISLPSGISMEFALNTFDPFTQLQNDRTTDRDSGRAYSREFEAYRRDTIAHTVVDPHHRVKVHFGVRSEQDGWSRYIVVERKNGLTIKHLRQIAERYASEERRSYREGSFFTTAIGIQRKTRTRVLFTQHGGLDI